MKIIGATTIDEYIAGFPQEQQALLQHLRQLINAVRDPHLDESYRWSMITREIPLSRYPKTYNDQPLAVIALARQKNNYALYLTGMYTGSNPRRDLVMKGFQRIGKKPDMGKSCVRFRAIEDIPLDEILTVARECSAEACIKLYEDSRK
ncbi:MAG: DUF1801 domain-containing protein [Candidatus Absconditabacterales bacterium]